MTVDNGRHAKDMRETKQYSTFRVGGLFLGVEVLKVQEIIRFQEMTEVPLAPGLSRA